MLSMKSHILSGAVGLICLGATASVASPALALAADRPAIELQRLIDAVSAGHPESPGIVMSINSPKLGLSWKGATGRFEKDKPQALRAEDAFRIASVTKVFVAATAWRLIEEGRFGAYEPIDSLISADTKNLLVKGGYRPDQITVQQLLSHTSGIFDYGETKTYLDEIFSNIHRRWTRREQIALAMQYGHVWAAPGKEFHYSDTGYVILGEIIERASDQPLGTAVSHLLDFQGLGLKSTYFEDGIQHLPIGEHRAHQYVNEQDYSSADPSMDLYGGGGIVSTTDDLVRFVRPLLQGSVFRSRSTLAAALIPSAEGESNGLLGVTRVGRHQCWSHGGIWGVEMIYCPDVDLAIAYSWGYFKYPSGDYGDGPRGGPSVGGDIETRLSAFVDEVADQRQKGVSVNN